MADFDWDALYAEYVQVRRLRDKPRMEDLIRQARTILSNRKLKPLDWLESALKDDKRQWFVASALRKGDQMPDLLFEPMIQTAISQPDPSSPRAFIEPLMRCFGPRSVNLALLRILEHGTDMEKAGAVTSLYFAMGLAGHKGIANEPMDDILVQERCLMLRSFVDNENVHLRRCLVPQLRFDEARYPDDLKPLVQEAIGIARGHPDAYIRHRIEIQLGASGLHMPLPDRPSPYSTS
jgi:hypothetical protein